MKRLRSWFQSMLNTWDEICENEDARLRTNMILFTFLVTCLYIVMVVANIVVGQCDAVLVPILLSLAGCGIFVAQVKKPLYSRRTAHLFGLIALTMCVFFLYSGGWRGYSFLWIFLVPHIAALVYKQRDFFIFNALLIALVCVLMLTPAYCLLKNEYDIVFRILFPISLVMVSLVVCLAEQIRSHTQERLNAGAAKLRAYAYSDPLTGAFNRRAIVLHLGDWSGEAHGWAFAIFDLDFFKKVNDQYGHMVGDDVICHVVKLIQQAAPGSSRLYRWGGEEFCLILQIDDRQNLGEVLNAVREVIARTPLHHPEGIIAVTVSIGAVCSAPGHSIMDCIGTADACLYKAKAEGRNRVVLGSLEDVS